MQTSNRKDPILTSPFTLPEKPIELFFDIETEPTQDIVYLHGVVERRQGETKEPFHAFVAHEVSPEAEKRAWQEFWDYIASLPEDDYVVYYYSKYERTQYRRLAQKYPEIASAKDVEHFFDPKKSIDLYCDIVKKHTKWPTYNYSIKTLAQHLGFDWRDKNPSGAASIQWYNDYLDTKSEETLRRILEYNEDDCKATIVVKDALQLLCQDVE